MIVKELGVLIGLALWIAGAIGWVLNIVTIAGSSLDPLTGEMLVRIIGIFIFPIGMVAGYF